MGIGSKLQKLLTMRGKKPGTLATETGISKNTIYGIIKRDNKKVDLSILDAISKNLGVTIDYFFDDSEGMIDDALTADEIQLLSGYRELSKAGKEYILQTLEMAKATFGKNHAVSDLADQA